MLDRFVPGATRDKGFLKSGFLFVAITLATKSVANEPYPIDWRFLSIEAYHESLGNIEVKAKETDDKKLRLWVDSGLSSGLLSEKITEGIVNPNIRSLSIQVTEPIEKASVSEFSVCLWYGDQARINVGTDDQPKYRWQQNQVTFVFGKDGVSRKVYRNTDVLKISSCNPG